MFDVSVIIPSFNHGHFLDHCLSSVLRQTEVSFEVILVDDGSTDDTELIVQNYSDRVSYVHQQNAGLSAARNTGLRHARGRYIQFLDADDILAPGSLRAKFMAATNSPSERSINVCPNRLFSEVGKGGRVSTNGRWGLYTTNLNLHLCRLNVAPPHAYFLSRDLIEEIGLFDESYKGCEDYDFWLRALGAGYTFEYNPNALVFYRKHPNSMGEKKARQGAFPFDVLVHQRKHSREYGPGIDAILATPAGKLALADGMLRTVVRIDAQVNPEGRSTLLNLAGHYLEMGQQLLEAGQYEYSFEVRLYLRRIAQLYVSNLSDLDSSEIGEVLNGLVRGHWSLADWFKDLKAMFPFNVYEKQLLTYAMLGLMKARI